MFLVNSQLQQTGGRQIYCWPPMPHTGQQATCGDPNNKTSAIGVNSGYLGLCTQHNVCIYRNLKANECSYVYIEVKANIL